MALSAAEVTVELKAAAEAGEGGSIGFVKIGESEQGLLFTPTLKGVAAGAYDFHIHENGDCSASKDLEGRMTPAGAAGRLFGDLLPPPPLDAPPPPHKAGGRLGELPPPPPPRGTPPPHKAGERLGELPPPPPPRGAPPPPNEDARPLGDLSQVYAAADGSISQPVLAPRIKKLEEIKGRSLILHARGNDYCGVIK
ncbi:MAG: superoxide dismutase family protein [Helicobacteraceae bacterium]|nr:superoxide dismutase family protein [Helicobacteraceae bacterium]